MPWRYVYPMHTCDHNSLPLCAVHSLYTPVTTTAYPYALHTLCTCDHNSLLLYLMYTVCTCGHNSLLHSAYTLHTPPYTLYIVYTHLREGSIRAFEQQGAELRGDSGRSASSFCLRRVEASRAHEVCPSRGRSSTTQWCTSNLSSGPPVCSSHKSRDHQLVAPVAMKR